MSAGLVALAGRMNRRFLVRTSGESMKPEAKRIAADMDDEEGNVFLILADAYARRDNSVVDGEVCWWFMRKGLMTVVPDGFVVTPLGEEVAKELRPAEA